MNKLGINRHSQELCIDLEVFPNIESEREALLENISCMKRLLCDFMPATLEAYLKMNEFFERKPFGSKKF